MSGWLCDRCLVGESKWSIYEFGFTFGAWTSFMMFPRYWRLINRTRNHKSLFREIDLGYIWGYILGLPISNCCCYYVCRKCSSPAPGTTDTKAFSPLAKFLSRRELVKKRKGAVHMKTQTNEHCAPHSLTVSLAQYPEPNPKKDYVSADTSFSTRMQI